MPTKPLGVLPGKPSITFNPPKPKTLGKENPGFQRVPAKLGTRKACSRTRAGINFYTLLGQILPALFPTWQPFGERPLSLWGRKTRFLPKRQESNPPQRGGIVFGEDTFLPPPPPKRGGCAALSFSSFSPAGRTWCTPNNTVLFSPHLSSHTGAVALIITIISAVTNWCLIIQRHPPAGFLFRKEDRDLFFYPHPPLGRRN